MEQVEHRVLTVLQVIMVQVEHPVQTGLAVVTVLQGQVVQQVLAELQVQVERMVLREQAEQMVLAEHQEQMVPEVQVEHQVQVQLQELSEFKEMMLPIQVDGSILILVLGAIQEVKILIPIIHRWPYQQDLVYIVMMSTQHYMNNGGKPVRHYLMLGIYFIYK